MRRAAEAGFILVALAWSGAGGASGDYGCTPSWSLSVSSYDCAGSALIGPRNDTRENLALLVRDQAGTTGRGKLSYPRWDWDNGEFGQVFFDWELLQTAFWPQPSADGGKADQEPTYSGSRCQTIASGAEAYRTALAAAKGLKQNERETLASARDLVKPACDGDHGPVVWPILSSKAGQGWLSYLQAARAFYADDFVTARARFAELTRAKNPWLAETARYMVARNELAAAQVNAFDEWGGYAGGDKVDRASAERGRAALLDYISAYRQGRYTESAMGLTRRAAWLLGDSPTLNRTYSGLLAEEPSQSPALLEEVESKVLFGTGIGDNPDAPLLLATWDLLRMRQKAADPYTSNEAPTPLTQAELAGQANVFSQQPGLYSFLQASFAYHVAKDYRRVLSLIPGEAPAAGYTPLAFSRQMLRGLALEKLGDRNTAAFFQQLAGGARDLYQQPAAQLALAMHWERGGKLASVYNPSSPITEPEIRTILLARIAGPDLLRRQAVAGIPTGERNVAMFTLLTKELSRGQYAEFGRDLAQVPAGAPATGPVSDGWYSGWMDPSNESAPPVGLFTAGKWQEDYACPNVARTAARLASAPNDGRAQLCLAEFWRLNDFDFYLSASDEPSADQLGGTADLFPGTMAPRAALYAAVLANRSTAPDDVAYALYRSVRCYAPSGNNECGGKDVPEAQRKAWFQRLKRDHAASKWAIKLQYYW